MADRCVGIKQLGTKLEKSLHALSSSLRFNCYHFLRGFQGEQEVHTSFTSPFPISSTSPSYIITLRPEEYFSTFTVRVLRLLLFVIGCDLAKGVCSAVSPVVRTRWALWLNSLNSNVLFYFSDAKKLWWDVMPECAVGRRGFVLYVGVQWVGFESTVSLSFLKVISMALKLC